MPLDRTGASAEWCTPPVSFGAPPDDQMSIAALEGVLSLSGDDDSAVLLPSGVVALFEPDPEMTAMLSLRVWTSGFSMGAILSGSPRLWSRSAISGYVSLK